MIINFNVANFGSIKEKQTLSFEADNSTHLENSYIVNPVGNLRLLKLGLIYGANASGKTTILKALNFLREIVLDPLEKKTDKLDFEPFLFNSETKNQPSTLSLEFLHNKIKYYYEVILTKDAILSEELYFYSPNKANVYKRKTNVKNQFTEISFGSKIIKDNTFKKTLESNTLWNNTVLGGFLKTNIELKELKEVTDWFNLHLKPLVYTQTNLDSFVLSQINKEQILKEDIADIIKKADFNISDILIKEEEKDIPDGFIEFIEKQLNAPNEKVDEIKKKGKITSVDLKFEHTINNEKYFLPFEYESEGTKRYFGFAGLLALLIKESITLPIDELESSLHPDLFFHFLLSFLENANNSQIIATTHNRELLGNKDIFRDDMIWLTDKDDNCSTVLYSFADFDSSVIRDTTNRLNAYKSGKLGGTPNLGDYYINLNK